MARASQIQCIFIKPHSKEVVFFAIKSDLSSTMYAVDGQEVELHFFPFGTPKALPPRQAKGQ
ncbi:MAG: hypothetical protein KJ588_03280 [Gammaproteobacteria bacterium]|nr:hypothetical protein [Gammaproteobacteria bacterium]